MSYRVAVAVSGRGSNLVALCGALAGESAAAVALVISDRSAMALDRARELGITAHQLGAPDDAGEWQRILEEGQIDLLVLAGYLRLVPAAVVGAMRNRIINIHPALLPLHGGRGMYGRRVHQAVLDAGETDSGATVHLVDEVYDRGTMLAQGRVPVEDGDTAESLAARVLSVEHRLLPAAVLAAAHAGHPVPFEFA